jgi:hypothetical protein
MDRNISPLSAGLNFDDSGALVGDGDCHVPPSFVSNVGFHEI